MITPPLKEQLGLLSSITRDKFSRILLIEGASHFSPIRVEGQEQTGDGDDLFQLGESLVGVQPLSVQSLLADQIVRFLEKFELGESLGENENKKNDSAIKNFSFNNKK